MKKIKWAAASKELQDSRMKHIQIQHHSSVKSYQTHLKQLKRIYHFRRKIK